MTYTEAYQDDSTYFTLADFESRHMNGIRITTNNPEVIDVVIGILKDDVKTTYNLGFYDATIECIKQLKSLEEAKKQFEQRNNMIISEEANKDD